MTNKRFWHLRTKDYDIKVCESDLKTASIAELKTNEKTFTDITIAELTGNAEFGKFELKMWNVKLQIIDI